MKSDFTNPVKFKSEYEIRLKILDKKNEKLLNFNVNLDFNVMKYPSYLFQEFFAHDIKTFKKKYFLFSQTSNYTDINGEFLSKFNSKQILSECMR